MNLRALVVIVSVKRDRESEPARPRSTNTKSGELGLSASDLAALAAEGVI
jgi:hypothetical protein